MRYIIVRRPRTRHEMTRYYGHRVWLFQTELAERYSTYNMALFVCNRLRMLMADYKLEVIKWRNSTI